MLLGEPVFPGESSIDQLVEIIKVLGTPTRDEVKEMNPNFTEYKFPQIKSVPWTKVFKPKVDPQAIDLVKQILVYSPKKRPKPLEILCHPFFDEIKKYPNCKINNMEIPRIFDLTESLFIFFLSCQIFFNILEEISTFPNIIDQVLPNWYSR